MRLAMEMTKFFFLLLLIIKFACLQDQGNELHSQCQKKQRLGVACNFPCILRCRHSDICPIPYFGYYCQYVDILKNASFDDVAVINDRDSKTCYKSANSSLHLHFFSTTPFSFIYLILNNTETVTLSYHRNNITLKFKYNEMEFKCRQQEIWEISRVNIEVRCLNESIYFTELSLEGSGVNYICEMYLSGGRSLGQNLNVTAYGSLKENLANSINGVVTDTECFSVKRSFQNDNVVSWILTLNQLFHLYRIRIRNLPETNKKHMRGFSLKTTDSLGRERTQYRYNQKIMYKMSFDIVMNSSLQVLQVIVFGPVETDYISMCEAELYGDCPLGKYRLDCDRSCDHCASGRCTIDGKCYSCVTEFGLIICRQTCSGCSSNSSCKTFEEVCPDSCKHGYYGDKCLNLCTNCGGLGQCNKNTGECYSNCADGYMGTNCSAECGSCLAGKCDKESGNCTRCLPGYFGSQCRRKCYKCRNSACYQSTGECSAGCHDGFRGKLCLLECGFCAGNGSCDQTYATCNFGCKKGYTGSDCTLKCGKCINGTDGSCHQNGTCIGGCEHGYTGVDCLSECFHCYNKNCNSVTGNCNQGCQHGYYGRLCESTCSNCDGNKGCDQNTGRCLAGCKPGFYMDTCSEECGHCKNQVCDRQYGWCNYKCQEGYTGIKCQDPQSKTDEYKKFASFIFYAVFLFTISLALIVLFFSQKLYGLCSVDNRENYDFVKLQRQRFKSFTTKSSLASTAMSSSIATSEGSTVDDIENGQDAQET